MYKSFEELEVWQRSKSLSVRLYQAFADSKCYTLRDQILRSALSVPSNIAEGAERGSNRDFIRFLHIAKGSAGEMRSQAYIARDIGAIDEPFFEFLKTESEAISRMLHGLIKSLEPKP